MALEDKTRAFEAIKKQVDENSRKKIRLEERLNNATENMKKVVTEVRAAGYEPKNLDAIRAETEQKLDAHLSDLTAKVSEQTRAIAEIEASL